MKQLLPIVLMALATTTAAQAQAPSLFGKNSSGYTAKAKAIAKASRSSAKATAAQWRLAATSNYFFDGSSLELNDSANYKYSNGRGSVLNTDELYVDDYGLSSTILYDTVVKLADNGGGLEPESRYISQYNNTNQRMEFLQQYDNGGGLKDNNKQLAVRDANGNITQETSLQWDDMGNQWDTSGITYRVFDNQNKLLSDSTVLHGSGMPTPWLKTLYTYDGTGNMIHYIMFEWNGSGWDSSARVFNTYSNNKIVTTLEQSYDTGVWVNDYADSTGYDNNGVYNYNRSKYWDVDSADWIYDELETRTINSKGLAATVFFSEWNDTTSMWELQAEGEVSYDANDNLTKIEVYIYIGGFKIPTPFFVSNMYWEYYFNVGVQDAEKKEHVVVYPNPASTNIHIVLGDKQDASIRLTGMTGQTVRTLQTNNGVQKVSMNIAGLPAGNYILSVESEGRTPARQLVTIQ